MARNIMIQGTMSNAGKSLIAAALCRIFRQDGYRAAPFKSQNMALNSFITRDGLEMGRAQVVQAEAAGIEPDVRMNPILLKPTTDVGSQVIVNGKAVANMAAMDYYRQKRKLVPYIMDAYNSLASEYDIIVIEGAGSPVEINLKDEDIVNMGLARMVNSPVLLVGDIDRGGVFAQLYGTVALLEPEERALLKGLIINKFRGDIEILRPGLKQMEELCKVPVTGVVPYVKVDIDDEDSLSSRFENTSGPGTVDIAVIKLPRISNFTDFSPFEGYEDVSLRYVDHLSDLGDPDMIILPGTKSTIADLDWLRKTGLEAAIQRKVRADAVVFGICGGFQMLGNVISDPDRTEVAEGAPDRTPGMGLLDMETVFLPEKHQTRVQGKLGGLHGIFTGLNGLAYEGYEIHMGISACAAMKNGAVSENQAFLKKGVDPENSTVLKNGNALNKTGVLEQLAELKNDTEAGEIEKIICSKNVYGTYVHGIFDAPGIVRVILDALSGKKGASLNISEYRDVKAYKDSQYDLLADAVRKGLDMDYIYSIL